MHRWRAICTIAQLEGIIDKKKRIWQKKQPKSSGLDIEDVMNDIDNQDELKKESEDLSNQLQEIHSAITQQKYLLKDMQFMTESLEQISKKLDRGAEINKEILGDIQTTISNTIVR